MGKGGGKRGKSRRYERRSCCGSCLAPNGSPSRLALISLSVVFGLLLTLCTEVVFQEGVWLYVKVDIDDGAWLCIEVVIEDGASARLSDLNAKRNSVGWVLTLLPLLHCSSDIRGAFLDDFGFSEAGKHKGGFRSVVGWIGAGV